MEQVTSILSRLIGPVLLAIAIVVLTIFENTESKSVSAIKGKYVSDRVYEEVHIESEELVYSSTQIYAQIVNSVEPNSVIRIDDGTTYMHMYVRFTPTGATVGYGYILPGQPENYTIIECDTADYKDVVHKILFEDQTKPFSMDGYTVSYYDVDDDVTSAAIHNTVYSR